MLQHKQAADFFLGILIFIIFWFIGMPAFFYFAPSIFDWCLTLLGGIKQWNI